MGNHLNQISDVMIMHQKQLLRFLEMPVIHLKIMRPFVNDVFVVLIKIFFKWVWHKNYL